jgi:hypothetical protein
MENLDGNTKFFEDRHSVTGLLNARLKEEESKPQNISCSF